MFDNYSRGSKTKNGIPLRRVDDMYRYCMRKCNAAAQGFARVAPGYDEAYIDFWTLRLVEQMIELKDGVGLGVLHLPEA
jgi:hypothetical protein